MSRAGRVSAFLASHWHRRAGAGLSHHGWPEGSPADEWLIRYAAHLAALSGARLQGVHVRAIDNLGRPLKARLDEDRRLLGELRQTSRVPTPGPAEKRLAPLSQAGKGTPLGNRQETVRRVGQFSCPPPGSFMAISGQFS
jgi:hypothetical protein